MKGRLWHRISVALLMALTPLVYTSCSSSEQGEDQVVENEDGDTQEGEAGNLSEDEGENPAAAPADGTAQAQPANPAGQKDELQEIIEGMNGQQGLPEAGAQTLGEGEAPQQIPAPTTETLNPNPEGNPMEQQKVAAGMAAAPGLPELGSKMSYVVKRGDTLASISTKIYGDMEKWREIAEFTGMADPNMIYPGDVIYYQLTDQTMAFASAYEAVSRAEVVVQPGDTLSTISAHVLGHSQDWKMIWRQNDNIDNPDRLTVGQTIYYIHPKAQSVASLDKEASETVAAAAVSHSTDLKISDTQVSKTVGGEIMNTMDNSLSNDFATLNNAGFTGAI